VEYTYYEENIARPRSSEKEFIEVSENCFQSFLNNNFIKKVNEKSLSLIDYHKLLTNLFYQVYYSSSSFSIAAGRCSWEEKIMRDYLIKHAEEEKTHWCWILDDLKSTGCVHDPRSSFPDYKAVSYYSYAHFLANKNPLLRLAMAYFLEGLSAKHGRQIGMEVCGMLNIKKEQASFFIQHGGLDEGHSDEVLSVIKKYQLDSVMWGEMVHAVICTRDLYSNLYNV
jgi:hypothetical protein